MEIYQYRYVGLTFTGYDLERVLEACPSGEALVENRSRRVRVECSGDEICVGEVCFEKPDSYELDAVYYLEDGCLRKVEVRSDHYIRLRVVGDGVAPTLEIDGIHMHRVAGIDPWTDSRLKVKVAGVRKGHRVLDTCTGLGYTAIISMLAGARWVLTFEINEYVLWAAERNPQSKLLDTHLITIVHGDVVEAVERLPDEFFDRIIHDPPRLTSETGDLYSLEFYKQLYRVLKPGGKLFHYTGRPHGGRVLQGIARRLQQAGFVSVKWVEKAEGFVAYKPRS